MKVLVINCGSSSLKYQLLDMTTEEEMAKGLVERIGLEGSRIKLENNKGEKKVIEVPMNNHKDALAQVLDAIVSKDHGSVESLSEIDAVGHRVVHAGEKYSASVLVDEDVMAALEECVELAPLHNPPNIMGIKAIQELLPGVPNIAVFDTAFHQTMPKSAYIYSLPYEYYEKYGLRRYGFHGTSHRFVSQRTAQVMGKDVADVKLVTCHLGNGASVAAIDGGKSVLTSMGFTPLEGLTMGTRAGDIDPAIVTFLMDKENLTIDQVNDVLNKKSGVYGISGVSSDFRDVEDAAAEGNERAQLALDIFRNKVRMYIAAYAASMGGVDAIVFTAGLGENSVDDRREICKGLEFLGVEFDVDANKVRGKERLISTENSNVKVYIIPTNEELMIARDTQDIVTKL